MNHRKTFTAALIVTAALGPLPAAAASEADAVAACARALTRGIEEEQQQPLRMRIDARSDDSRSRLRSAAVFHLDAIDRKSDAVVARAACYVDEDARVHRLEPLPLDAPDATTRAKG